MQPDKNFWHKKKVLLTGNTGFKGSWLGLWLKKLEANVLGLSADIPTKPSLYNILSEHEDYDTIFDDINNYTSLKTTIETFHPEIIFHLAAQPLVIKSYADPIHTFQTNVMGLANLLAICSKIRKLRCIVIVTSDKCYDPSLENIIYKETAPFGGNDPYSCSKACAELVTNSFRKSFYSNTDIGLATVRAGNIFGGGDWAKNRIVPDTLKSIANSKPLTLRFPEAIRPWQHVLDPLNGYIKLAEKLFFDKDNYEGGWNFGPENAGAITVRDLVHLLFNAYGRTVDIINDKNENILETKTLKLCTDKSKTYLKWEQKWEIKDGISKTAEWHKRWLAGEDMTTYCLKQIEAHEKA